MLAEAANKEEARSGPRDRLLFGLASAICLLALIWRRPDAFMMPWFYAEEGRDFLAQAYHEGWASCFNRTNGYFHLFPRLTASLGIFLGIPLMMLPWLNLAALLVLYATLWRYAWTRFPAGRTARFVAVVSTVLVPLGNEIWMNMTNAQWPMALLIVLILFGRPAADRRWRAVDALACLLAAFTGPFALVLAPVALWRLWHGRSRIATGGFTAMVPFLIVLFGAVASAASLALHGSVARTDGAFEPFDPGFVQAAFFQLWFPLLGKGIHETPAWMHGLLVALALAGLALVVRRRSRGFSVAAFAAAASLFLVVLVSYRGEPGFLSPYYAGIRNFYLPAVLVAWALIAAVDWGRRVIAALFGAMCAWWAVQTIVFVGPLRFRDEPAVVDLSPLTKGQAVEVPIDPQGWTMRLEPRR